MPPVHVLLQLRPQSRETFELILTLLPAAEGRLLIPGRERGILPIHCHAAASTHARACLHASMHCSQMLFSMYCKDCSCHGRRAKLFRGRTLKPDMLGAVKQCSHTIPSMHNLFRGLHMPRFMERAI